MAIYRNNFKAFSAKFEINFDVSVAEFSLLQSEAESSCWMQEENEKITMSEILNDSYHMVETFEKALKQFSDAVSTEQ